MEQCRVEYCGKIANLDGVCLFHRKKDIAGGLERADGRVYDTCAGGHRWVPENTHWESNQKGGKRRRCKLCLLEKQERKRNEDPAVETPQPIRLTDPTMRKAFGLMDTVSEHIDGKCKGNPGPYTGYTAATAPTDVEAAKLCSGCPLLAACGNNAVATRPGWGVWGGQVWLYGQPYDGDRGKFSEED